MFLYRRTVSVLFSDNQNDDHSCGGVRIVLDPSTGSTLLEHLQAQRNKGEKYIFGTNNPTVIFVLNRSGLLLLLLWYFIVFCFVFCQGFFKE